ncbi:hypothetical protein KUL113_62920 [Tenacibaculum sp. KUL113]|nr:hypothetical protein KUL113_62920 [Tenacibaculum sp. KUL113]
MKQKLLWLLLLVVTVAFSQTVPTNGLVEGFEFTTTNYLKGVNNGTLSPVGTLQKVPDRFGDADKAIQLNTGYFLGPNLQTLVTGTITCSFWIKTTSNTSFYQTIIDDSNRSASTQGFGISEHGYSAMLRDGKIYTYTKVQYYGSVGATRSAVSRFVADGNWHHIVVKFSLYRPGVNQFLKTAVYIDGQLDDVDDASIGLYSAQNRLDGAYGFAIGHNSRRTLSSNYRYNGIVDDIYMYNRDLSSSEINTLKQVGGYCFQPNRSNISVHNNITPTSIEVGINEVGTFDIAYHKASEPFSSATVIQSVNSTGTVTTNITGLDSFTSYKIYVRKRCSSTNVSLWSNHFSITTLSNSPLYVSKFATGNNDGSSWANAFTSLKQALLVAPANSTIWVSVGTYTPHASDINESFIISKRGIKLYGGFLGNETMLSQRLLGNKTTLSGDLGNNDNPLTMNFANNYADATRNNVNSHRVVRVVNTDVLIDGFTIKGAHNAISATSTGAAIVKDATVEKLTIRNCVIKDNVARNTNAGIYAPFNLNNISGTNAGSLSIVNCKFENNYARLGTAVFVDSEDLTRVHLSIVNNLFANNFAGDLSSTVEGRSASAMWIRVKGNSGVSNGFCRAYITNNTFAKNKDNGTASGQTFDKSSPLVLSKQNSSSGRSESVISNNIFYHNTTNISGSTANTFGISRMGYRQFNTMDLYKNILFNTTSDCLGLFTANSANSYNDPLFTDIATDDFTIQSSSPAIDSGDNSKVPTSIVADLAGNVRIHNTTVDRGSYEFGATAPVYRDLTITSTNGTVTANPQPSANGMYVDGTSVTLTATPNSGYQFDNWVISPSPATAPNGATATVVLNADTNVTANFSLIPRPTSYVTGLPHGNTTTGVFIATVEFDTGVTGFDISDIQVTGATLSNFTGVSGTNLYTFDVTPTNTCVGTPITLKVPENVAFDVNNSSVGNTASALKTITVKENVKPTVKTQNLTVQLDANGNASITPQQIDNGSTDNCSIASMSLDKTTFDCNDTATPNTVTLTVEDTAGNTNTATATVIVQDNIAPVVATKNVTINLDANNQATITASDVLDTAIDNCTSSTNLTTVLSKTTFDCSNLGTNTINVQVRDAIGNTTNESAVVTVNANPNATLQAVAKNITVYLATDGSATITPQDVDNGSGSGCNSNPTLSLDITSFNCSNVGTNNVVLTATDGINTATVSAVVTVEDNILPTVTTQNLTVQLDARGNGTITPQQIDNGSTDNCSIASMSLDKTTFDCSNIGVNQVLLTVVDVNNNTSTAAATVTVEDTIVPTVVTQDISVQLGANNQVSIAPTQINNGSSDNCTSATDLTYSLDVTTFSCSEVGNNTVTLTVTDASGNSATATAQVTVTANPSAPLAVVTQNITVQLDASGSVTIQPSDVDNSSGSGCNSNPTLSLDKTNFDCSNIGTNTVTLTATDGGASETAMAIVTVEDIMVPTVNTKDVTVTLSNGQGSITISDVNDNSTDNCSIASIGLDKTTFDCSNLGTNTVTLTVTDDQGNTSTGTATVTVVETDAPTVVTRDITVALDANGEATITAQQVDNGSSDACSGVANMSLDNTTFQCPDLSTPTTVTLTVIDNSGNTATGTARVTFTAPDEDNDGISDACDTRQVVSPKGFSPNGDGQNDTWVIENIEKFPNSNIQVFNRWGERVYESKGYQNNWSANSNQRGGSSTKLPVGAYYYIINLNDSDYPPVQGWLYINY